MSRPVGVPLLRCTHVVSASGAAGRTVPASASAYLRASLVHGQDPDRVAEALTQFIVQNSGLPVEVNRVDTWRWPARAKPPNHAVEAAMAVAEQVYEQAPVLVPLTSGSRPRDVFLRSIDVPLVSHSASNDHAANENISVEH